MLLVVDAMSVGLSVSVLRVGKTVGSCKEAKARACCDRIAGARLRAPPINLIALIEADSFELLLNKKHFLCADSKS